MELALRRAQQFPDSVVELKQLGDRVKVDGYPALTTGSEVVTGEVFEVDDNGFLNILQEQPPEELREKVYAQGYPALEACAVSGEQPNPVELSRGLAGDDDFPFLINDWEDYVFFDGRARYELGDMTAELIERMLPFIEEFVHGGLVTIEDVTIVHQSRHSDLVNTD